MSSSLFKDEKRTQYSPLMTREEQVRDRDDGRRATMGRRETIWLDDADETTARRRRRTKGRLIPPKQITATTWGLTPLRSLITKKMIF